MDVRGELRQRLVELMDERRVSGRELASAINVSPQAVSNWKNGKSSIDVDRVPAICSFFDITVSDFFGSSGSDVLEFALSDDEKKLVSLYRELSLRGKHAVIAGLEDFATEN